MLNFVSLAFKARGMKFFLLITFALIFLLSCTPHKKENEKRKVFCYNEYAGITSLDPAFAKDQANIWATNQLYNGLVQLDEKLLIKPCIAQSWEISHNGITYTFHLRKDVFFHDNAAFPANKGKKVTAKDFVYSFNRIIDEKLASPGAWVFNNVDLSAPFNAIDDSTFQINLKQCFPPFLGLLTMQYCSVVPHEAIEKYGKDFRNHPVGTGPFQFKMWKEGVKLVLVKSTNYFEYDGKQRLPYLDAVAITFIMDKQTGFLEFIKGNLDFLSGIDASYKDELLTRLGELNPKYKDKFNMISQPYLNTEYLGFLMDTTSKIMTGNPLSLKLIRRAINYGFDRKKMMRYLRNNVGTAASGGIVPLGMPGFTTEQTNGFTYDPEKAKALLREAGYPGGEGMPEITLITTSSYLDICKYIQSQLAEIGIKLKIDVNPPATLREMISGSKIAFFRGSWIADYADAENYLSLFYSKNFCPKGPNYTHYSNPSFDALFEKAQKEINDSIRYTYYYQMDQLVMDDAAIMPLYYDQVLRFTQKNISGLGCNPLNLLDLKRVRKLITPYSKQDLKPALSTF